MDNSMMTDADLFANGKRKFLVCHMNDTEVLNIAARANSHIMHITAHNTVHPHT